jgi:AcrR family transcriptional regulator
MATGHESQRAHPRGKARQAVLGRARELFSARGYDATTVREIAQSARVSEAVVYRYFPSKIDLFEEALTQPYWRFIDSFLDKWSNLDHQLGTDEMVIRFVRELYDVVTDNRDALLTLIATNRFSGREMMTAGALSSGIRTLAAYTANEADQRGFGKVDLEVAIASTIAMVSSMALLDDLLFTPGSGHPSHARLVDGMSNYASAGVQQILFGARAEIFTSAGIDASPGPMPPTPSGAAEQQTSCSAQSPAVIADFSTPKVGDAAGQRSAATTDRIVRAARRCFASNGVSATRMSAVAAEAQLARPTLYKFIGSRRELIELALIERCRELLVEMVNRAGPGSGDVREDVIEFLAVMVEVTRGDPEFAELADALPRDNAFGLLSGPSELRSIVQESLKPYFDRAAAQGVLRPIARDELTGLAQTVMTPLAARADLDGSGLRQTLCMLLGPALFQGDN